MTFKEYQVPKFTLVMFVIYTIIYELIIWGGVGYLLFALNWSEWTIVVGILMSSAQLKLEHFDSNYALKKQEVKAKELENDRVEKENEAMDKN